MSIDFQNFDMGSLLLASGAKTTSKKSIGKSPSPKVLGMRGCIVKNPRPTLTKDSVKIEYISIGQPSPYELTLGIKLGSTPHILRKRMIMYLQNF